MRQFQTTPAARALEAMRGGGKPLPAQVEQRAAQEYGFGFGHVRVHDEPAAHGAARSLRAAAYTIGPDIAFAQGRYAPGSDRGDALMQHELRHVAQQRWSAASSCPQLDPADSLHEQDAREPFAATPPALAEQRIQCAPEEEPFSLGGATVDFIGRKATSDTSWPFIKAILEGFVDGLKEDVKAKRADSAKSHLAKLLNPMNAGKFYVGYLVGLVIGLVSPITDIVKGVIGLCKLGKEGLVLLAKWSPAGLLMSADRRDKVEKLTLKLNDLTDELLLSLLDFAKNPIDAAKKFSGFLNDLMQMAQSKARGIGREGAHKMFDFLGSEFYEMGKGIGETIGFLIAQALMLVFTAEIGNLVAKGAGFVGKVAEVVAGKAVEAFTWFKGFFVQAGVVLRQALNGALKLFKGVFNKAVEAFDAIVELFSEAAAGERAMAGARNGPPGKLSSILESRMVDPAAAGSAGTAAAEAGGLVNISLSNRHFLGSLSVPKATGNSLFLGPQKAAWGDLAEIRAGTAKRTGDLFETSSGRVWGKHGGSVHPVSGADVVNVTSQEYNVLLQAQKVGVEKALVTLDHLAAKSILTPAQVEQTKKILDIMRSLKNG